MTSSTLSDPDPDRRRTQPIAPPSPDPDHRATLPATPSADVVAEFTTFYKAALPRLWRSCAGRAHRYPMRPTAPRRPSQRASSSGQPSSGTTHGAGPQPREATRATWPRSANTRATTSALSALRPSSLPPTSTPSNTDTPLLAVLDRLPLRQRQVLAWTYDGATTTEIAETLQISPDAVRSNLHHARTTLRAHRDELGVDR